MTFTIKNDAGEIIHQGQDLRLCQLAAYAELAKGEYESLEVWLNDTFMGRIGWNVTRK